MGADLDGQDAGGVLQVVLGHDLVGGALVGCHTHVLEDEGACATPTPHWNPTSACAACYVHLQHAILLHLELVIEGLVQYDTEQQACKQSCEQL